MLMAWLLSEDSNRVDIGVHYGAFTRFIVRLAPRGRHMASESSPGLASLIVEEFPTVEVANCAPAAVDEWTEDIEVINHPGLSGLRQQDWEEILVTRPISVRARPLDDILDPLQEVKLIKIDVEGAELEVLRGAGRTSEQWRLNLIFEFAKRTASLFGSTPESIMDFLAPFGYRVFDIDGLGPYTVEEFWAAYEREDIWNFVAHI